MADSPVAEGGKPERGAPAPSRRERLLACGLLATLALLAGHTAWRKSPVIDEPHYLYAGACSLQLGDFRFNEEHPPLLKQLFALPLVLAGFDLPPDGARRIDMPQRYLFELHRDRAEQGLLLGRSMMLLLALAGGWLVWRWSREIHGAAGGIVSLALYCLCPLVIGHAGLCVLDLGCGILSLLAAWALRRLARDPTPGRILAAGLALGAALATKFTALVLLPIGLALLVVEALVRREFRAPLPGRLGAGGVASRGAGAVVMAFLVAALTAGFLYADYGLQQEPRVTAPWELAREPASREEAFLARDVPVPAPSFLRGLEKQREHADLGHPNYLLGKTSSQGWPHFFVVAALARLPIPILLLGVVAAGLTLLRRRGRDLLDDLWLLVFPAAVFVALSFFSKAQLGLKYLLPAFPFVFVFAGRAGAAAYRAGRAGRIGLLAMVAWLALGTLSIHPDHLMYANEIAGGAVGGVRWTVVGCDWGQDVKELGVWLREKGFADTPIHYRPYGQEALARYESLIPSYYGVTYEPVPCAPAPGIHAVHIVDLLRPWRDQGCLDWLRAREPIARIGGSIWVYEVAG